MLATCIRSIRTRTQYDDYEIIIVDNGSVQQRTRDLFAELRADPAIRILARPAPFNFSRLNNAAAREASGAILCLLNNDIEVTHGGWLAEMVALAVQHPEIGCVGAKLLYPDGRIQHAGVVAGLGGVAGHAHRFAHADDPGYLERLRFVHDVSAVTAACLLIRREVFDAVGGLDEELTVAFNDGLLPARARPAIAISGHLRRADPPRIRKPRQPSRPPRRNASRRNTPPCSAAGARSCSTIPIIRPT